MPTSSGGIVYPSDTDDPDVPGDLQALAESIDAGVPVVTSGFTIASGWTLTQYRFKRMGAFAHVRLDVVKATSAITVAAGSGDIANVKIGDVPAGHYPSFTAGLGPGPAGRVASGFIQTDGQVYLNAVAGDGTNVQVGDTISLTGVIPLA